MDKPVLSIANGIVEWEAKANATEYVVNIYEINSSNISESVVVRNNSFDLLTINKSGLIEIEVKAISDREDTLNSAFSEKISAYRLPKPTNVYVDDGNLILEAVTPSKFSESLPFFFPFVLFDSKIIHQLSF